MRIYIYLISVKSVIYFFLAFNFQMLTINCISQSGGVAINSTGGAADNSAMLDVSSTNQGMRIPRVALINTTSAAPITNPANSLLVYDSVTTGDVTPGFYYWDASKWVRIATGSGGWSTSGNAGTDTATNFIGTTDNQSWVMKTNNIERMKISKSGNIGIGTSNPSSSAILDVSSTTKGQLIPRMNSVNRDAIVSPAVGLQIFNIDCNMNEYYTGSCWVSMGKSLPDPKNITSSPASTDFCAGQTRTYSISSVTGADFYTWTVPAGATINSGQGTTSISVTFGNNSGNVCVNASNSCETSGQSCIAIVLQPLADTPGGIAGLNSVYPYQQSVTYSITGSGNYTWSVPSGVTITSGQGTNSIIVNFACNALSGNIGVAASNSCGLGTASTLAVTVTSLVASAGPAKFGGSAIGGSPTASAGTSPYTYSWSPTTNLSSTTISNPTAQCSGTTSTYTVTVTDNKSCTATSSVVVSRITASSGGNQTNTVACGSVVIGGSPTASNGAGSYTYSWSPSTGLSSTTIANPTATPAETTTYNVTVTDANTCTASNSMILTINTSANTTTKNYTGGQQTFTVPAGITCLAVQAYGAGASSGGLGGRVQTRLSVTPSETIYIYVGGSNGNAGSGSASGGSGANVGGAGTDIRQGGVALSNRVIVAGGGGGNGQQYSAEGISYGGAGGYPSGNNGSPGGCCPYGGSSGGVGSGGSQTAGGARGGCGTTGCTESTDGNSSGAGGNGGSKHTSGGGGGGGYFGGGGGGGGYYEGGGSGGGGSSYAGTGTSSTIYTTGHQSGDGKVIISW